MGTAHSTIQSTPIRLGLIAAVLLAAAGSSLAQPLDLAVSYRENSSYSSINPLDHEVAARNTTPAWLIDLAAMTASFSASVNLDALDYMGPTSIYFSLEEDASLGGTVYADEDVVFWNGATFAMAFDGSLAGLPVSADLDALDMITASPFQASISLDVDCFINVGGVNTLVADEDVVHFTTGAAPSPFTVIDFDGSVEGIVVSADLDGFNRRTATQFEISLDSAGQIPGASVTGGAPLNYDDSDIIEWNTGTSQFAAALFFTASASGVPASADLDAIEANTTDLNPTPSPTPTASPSPSPTLSPTPSASPTASPSASPTISPSPTISATPSATPTASPSPTPNASRSWSSYE